MGPLSRRTGKGDRRNRWPNDSALGAAAADHPHVTDAPTPQPPVLDDADAVDKGRLASFSDNVISIALTLLVLDVRLPPDLDRLTIPQALHLLAPRLLGFGLSFAIVGVFWVGHHLMFKALVRAPRSLLWTNNLFLLFTSLVPASAALLGSYPHQRAAAVLYGANLMAVTGSLLLMSYLNARFHRRHGLPLPPASVRRGYRRTGGGMGIAAAGIGLAWVSPWISYAVYCLTPVGFIVLQLMPEPAPAQAATPAGR